jgi:hypothetical protein
VTGVTEIAFLTNDFAFQRLMLACVIAEMIDAALSMAESAAGFREM